ncbi:MAG TPA: hypothetical protein VGX48_22375 [Pyrinomonadaceae bacterium]|jgi:hypothetical protein|nr:hypothetical protein [Pyrinomonadaceae bacterium]
MMRQRATRLAFLCGLLVLCASARASAQQFDIGSGGLPTITGARNGSVTGSTDVTENLVVNVNFGEVSPINSNNVVRVVVPISIRSTSPYQVSVTVSGAFDANPLAVQRSDIGFGARNLRMLGSMARVCNDSAHVFRSPFNNDPSTSVSLDANGRAAYPSSLANLGASTVILSGPELTKGNNITRKEPDNGYSFDAIFALRPQFYAPGNFSATLTFTISAGPNVRC